MDGGARLDAASGARMAERAGLTRALCPALAPPPPQSYSESVMTIRRTISRDPPLGIEMGTIASVTA